MVEGNSHIHHQQPLCPVNAVLCPSQQADLETSTGSPRGKLRTTNTLHCLSPKARDDKTPSKTNLGVEGWSCTWAANKIHKEGPILKASEEAGPLMATAPRSWRKANTRLCKYEMTTEGKYEENANPKQTQDVRCSRMQSIRCYTHTLTFWNRTWLSLHTDAFPKFWKITLIRSQLKLQPSLHTSEEKDLSFKECGLPS